MHYDVRLEIDGVLKSWPAPKGPSLNPEDRRLAVMTEDHPLEYASFEGIIPRGEYGAGQMIVWDAGIYSPDEDGKLSFGDREESQRRMRAGLESGKLSFTLRGRKLRGSWALVKTSRDPNEWLLIKHRDRHADPDRDILLEDRSILSGLTIADLKAGRLPDSHRRAAGVAAPFPTRPTPMMAASADRPFSNAKWIFEPKLDGFRALVLKRGGDVRVLSRTGNDMTDRVPAIVKEVSQLQHEELVMDGELVAAGENGLPDFTLLQRTIGLHRLPGVAEATGETGAVTYYPFDLLYVDGRDVTGLPLIERKSLLSRSVLAGEALRPMEYVEADGESFFEAAVGMGIEGMVGKRRDSRYEQGARSPAWVKVKAVQAQEFVVGGYTAGSGARSSTFGALMLGYHDEDGLRYAGRVGSGFDDRTLDEMLPVLEGLTAEESPFVDEPDVAGVQPVWVKPELVVQVKYTEWREGGHLRAPVFLHVRRDVEPSAVVREAVARPSAPVPAPAPQAPANAAAHVVEQLEAAGDRGVLDVQGHRVAVTNLDKALWPETEGRRAITKRDMIRYYARMGPVLVPHLRARPLTMTRYPDGVEAESFYQKHWGTRAAGLRRDGAAVLVAQRGGPGLRHGEQPGYPGVAGAARRHRDAPVALAHGNGRRRRPPDDRLRRLARADRVERAQSSRLYSLRPGPVHLLRQGAKGGRAGAEPGRVPEGRRGRLRAEGDTRRPVAVVVPQDVRQDRPAHIPAGAAPVRLQGDAQGVRDDRTLPDAGPPA